MNSGFMYAGEQKGEVSLLLKQLKVGSRKILLALIGVDTDKEWEDYLALWFYKRVASIGKEKQLLSVIEEELEKEIPHPKGEVFGICICGNQYISFGKGGIVGTWIYRRYLGYKSRDFHNMEEWQVCRGLLEKGGGILISTKEYSDGISVENLGHLMLDGRRISDKQISKRLVEGSIMEKGGAAIFICL